MIGIRLKELRSATNKTQADVASYLGISRASYSHFENDRNEPDNITLSKLADYFNVTTDYLLGREVKQPANNSRNEKADLVAAHIDDDVTESEMKQITDFIDFLKSKQ